MKANGISLMIISTFALFVVNRVTAQWIEWRVSEEGNGHSYRPVLVTNLISWDEASRNAVNEGGYLATLTSAAENDFVFSLINFAEYWNGELGPVLGGYQPPGSPEPAGGWTWVTGEPWAYSNWAGGEPNNGDIPSEDGLHFWRGNQWNDKVTNRQQFLSYVIERESCTPHKAKATAQVVNGFVVGATVMDAGCGYTDPPLVLIEGGGGTGATATAVITDGQVIGITMVNAGCCYTNTPKIVIASPPFVPSISISVSKVRVLQNVVLGRRYVLEASHDAKSWSQALPSFTATSESITNEFDVDLSGRFFRVRKTP